MRSLLWTLFLGRAGISSASLSQRVEAHSFASHILKNRPQAKIAVLYQDDDFGRGYLKFLKEGLGERASSVIVSEAAYSSTSLESTLAPEARC